MTRTPRLQRATKRVRGFLAQSLFAIFSPPRAKPGRRKPRNANRQRLDTAKSEAVRQLGRFQDDERSIIPRRCLANVARTFCVMDASNLSMRPRGEQITRVARRLCRRDI